MSFFPDITSSLAPPIPDLKMVTESRSMLVQAAQSVYDDWMQGDDGLDNVYGAGGICDDIAEAMCRVLSEMGVRNAITHNSSIGENHTFVIANFADGVYSVDIPPAVYEIGSGYVWKKKQNVQIDADDIVLFKVSDPLGEMEFESRFCE